MATDEERESWKTDPDAAYAEAERRIEVERMEGSGRLDCGDGELLALNTIPPAISALSNLETLDFDYTQVSDITPIAALKKLRTLHLRNTQVKNIAPIIPLINLQTLLLNNTNISDVAPIAVLANLLWLDLDNTQVNEVVSVASLGDLQGLFLTNTKIEDLSPIRELTGLAKAVKRDSEPFISGLHYFGTPVAEREVFRDLVTLDPPECTDQTFQYLNGTHPKYGGPPPELKPSASNRTALLANPPAEAIIRRGKIDLDPAPPGDAPENAEDRELATLPRRQQNLADQIRGSLGHNQPTTERALEQYREELARPQVEIILEILKEAYLTAKAGIKQAWREGALDDDALAAWEQFDANHGLYLAHHPFDAEREQVYRTAPVDMEKADPAAVAKAFADFLDTLNKDDIAEVIGPRLQDWAESSADFSQVIADMALASTMRGDIPDEDMPHRVWLRRQVAQGWVMMVKLKEFLLETEEGQVIGITVGFTSGIVTLLTALAALML